MRLTTFALLATIGVGIAGSSAESPRWQLAQYFGQRCATQQGLCFMGQPGLVGQSCWCPTPYGPVPGVIVQ